MVGSAVERCFESTKLLFVGFYSVKSYHSIQENNISV